MRRVALRLHTDVSRGFVVQFDRRIAGAARVCPALWAVLTLIAVSCAGVTRAVEPARTAEAVTRIRVTHVVSDRFPALTDGELATVLRTAGDMVESGFGRRVEFVPRDGAEGRRTAEDFFGELGRAIGPYAPRAGESFDPFTAEREDLLAACAQAVRSAGHVGRLHRYLDLPEPFADASAAAEALADAYVRRFELLRELRGPDGTPRLDAATYHQQASLARWDVYLAHAGPKRELDLILFNGLLVEDSTVLSSFHTLSFATANGTAYPVANNCVVGYFPLVSDDPAARSDRLGPLAPAERLTAIAYAAAHEAGAHLLMLRRDDYAPGAGLARPLMALADRRELLDYRAWPPPSAPPRPIGEIAFRCEIIRTRLGIAASRRDADAMRHELEALDGLPVDPEWKDRVKAWTDELYHRPEEPAQ
jgi:hypothetical protein